MSEFCEVNNTYLDLWNSVFSILRVLYFIKNTMKMRSV
jgi:hypothetical protein